MVASCSEGEFGQLGFAEGPWPRDTISEQCQSSTRSKHSRNTPVCLGRRDYFCQLDLVCVLI